jgi:hypothetical protein
MNLIRAFLWGLVGVMTLQGFLHADEYGSAASMIGGMSLTMSVWSESLSAGTRSLFWSEPKFVGLPRSIVVAALHETARHPGLQIVPQLQRKIKSHQHVWERFRTKEMGWMLEHADLVGGLLSDPDAVELWSPWFMQVTETEAAFAAAKTKECALSMFHQESCRQTAAAVTRLKHRLTVMQEVATQWDRVLKLSRWSSAAGLVSAIQQAEQVLAEEGGSAAGSTEASGTAGKSNHTFVEFVQGIARLHDVTEPYDERLSVLAEQSHNIAWNLTVAGGNPWLRRLIESLLNTEIWNGCLDHIQQREGRVRRLMIAAGLQELFTAHERVLNASLVVVTATAEVRLVQDWFGEMSGYAWWLSDEIPSLVRRCMGQEAGDCARIGPTEITALSSQIAERSRIVEDWVRCLFIGMWNALPAIAVLFIMEIVILCLSKRGLVLQQKPELADATPRVGDRPRQPLLQNTEAPENRQMITPSFGFVRYAPRVHLPRLT